MRTKNTRVFVLAHAWFFAAAAAAAAAGTHNKGTIKPPTMGMVYICHLDDL